MYISYTIYWVPVQLYNPLSGYITHFTFWVITFCNFNLYYYPKTTRKSTSYKGSESVDMWHDWYRGGSDLSNIGFWLEFFLAKRHFYVSGSSCVSFWVTSQPKRPRKLPIYIDSKSGEFFQKKTSSNIFFVGSTNSFCLNSVTWHVDNFLICIYFSGIWRMVWEEIYFHLQNSCGY